MTKTAPSDYRSHAPLKPPVWTWEIPLYFFIGGMAGMAAALALAAELAGTDPTLVRDALRLAALGAVLSPPLLVSDLGRPQRFLNMLRIWKPRSPMSLGAWVLAAFGPFAVAAAALDTWPLLPLAFRHATMLGGAVTGLLLATYTGVLLAATAIPLWHRHARSLPLHFAAAGLGSAVAALELGGHGEPALWTLGVGASGVECALLAALLLDDHAPRSRTPAGRFVLGSAAVLGPICLALRCSPLPSWLPALLFLAAAIASRFAWIAAGRESALGTDR